MGKRLSEIPEYWEKHLENKIKRILSLKETMGEECVCTAMITDFHWLENEKHSVPMLEKILRLCDIPYFFQGGDVVSGRGIITPEELIEEIRGYKELFYPLQSKCLCAEGNHDRAYSTFLPPAYYVENLKKKEFDDLYFSHIKNDPDKVYGEGGYYYTDDKKRKVRYIVLNSNDLPNDETDDRGYAKYNPMFYNGFLQKQIKWFANSALDVPDSGWSVLVCSHISPNGAKYVRSYNYDLMVGVFEAFGKGIVYEGRSRNENRLFDAEIVADYTKRGGKVIAWLGGHIHKDEISMVNNVLCIDTAADSAFCSLNPEKRGTTKEQAFDVFVIEPKSRYGEIVRIGAGEDRSFSF